MPGKVMVFVCEASHPAIINMTVNVTVVMVMMPDKLVHNDPVD